MCTDRRSFTHCAEELQAYLVDLESVVEELDLIDGNIDEQIKLIGEVEQLSRSVAYYAGQIPQYIHSR